MYITLDNLRLVGGPSRCEGLVEILGNFVGTEYYAQACDLGAGNTEAMVICRQIGCNPKRAQRVSASL